MSFAEEVSRAVREGRINPKRNDLGLTPGPDDCEMVICGNKKAEGCKVCELCEHRFRVAIKNLVEEIDVKRADWWKK